MIEKVRDERQGEDRGYRRGGGPHHGPHVHDRGADGHERALEHGDQELGGGDREESGSVRCWHLVDNSTYSFCILPSGTKLFRIADNRHVLCDLKMFSEVCRLLLRF